MGYVIVSRTYYLLVEDFIEGEKNHYCRANNVCSSSGIY